MERSSTWHRNAGRLVCGDEYAAVCPMTSIHCSAEIVAAGEKKTAILIPHVRGPRSRDDRSLRCDHIACYRGANTTIEWTGEAPSLTRQTLRFSYLPHAFLPGGVQIGTCSNLHSLMGHFYCAVLNRDIRFHKQLCVLLEKNLHVRFNPIQRQKAICKIISIFYHSARQLVILPCP